ncbi:MAG: NFACT RNA binding domain-containing protein [Candidatus Kryptonium sp.]|nr:NFACT RNA binding domain-containing protein [Candidatus Kryptonium sp.]MDW8108282.1 NFACT RNA binding domain-containing protein [Candidatus Kryptonium sp.]
MITNYHTLKNLVKEIKSRIEGTTINESFTQEKDTLHINLEGENAFTLELNATGQGYMFLRPKLERARKNSLDIFPEIQGDKIVKIEIHKADRIIEVLLSSKHKLLFQFFTGKVNFFLTTIENEIIASFKNPKENIGRKFEFEKVETNYDVMINNFEVFKSFWESSNVDEPISRLIKIVDTIDMLIAREVVHRSGDANVEKIWLCLKEIDKELNNPKPRIYYDGVFPRHFSIIELTHLNFKKVEFAEINEAIRRFVIETRINRDFYNEKKSILEKLKHLLDKTIRTIEKVEKEINENQRARMYEIYGSILMANLNALHKGMSEVELLNVFSEKNEKVRIKLDPSLSPVENAERYFEKAKKTKASLKIAEERLERLKVNKEKLNSLIQKVDKCENHNDLKKFKDENFQDLKAFGIIKDKVAEKIGSKFRRFVVDGGFEVWVGKDAKSNDLLTLKFSDKEDLWFHARGVRGAHVVLKTGRRQPSKKAIEQAGGIAAYFSEAKTSSLVPVIVTKRKYVRKPRGAPEGSVIVEREEVIMVEPKLPSEEIE